VNILELHSACLELTVGGAGIESSRRRPFSVPLCRREYYSWRFHACDTWYRYGL